MVVVWFMLEQKLDTTDWKGYKQEVEVLSLLQHKSIPKLYGMIYDTEKYYIFMEHVKGTSATAIHYLQVLSYPQAWTCILERLRICNSSFS